MAGVDYTEDWFQRIIKINLSGSTLLAVSISVRETGYLNGGGVGSTFTLPNGPGLPLQSPITIDVMSGGFVLPSPPPTPVVNPFTPEMLRKMYLWQFGAYFNYDTPPGPFLPGNSFSTVTNNNITWFVNLASFIKNKKHSLPFLDFPVKIPGIPAQPQGYGALGVGFSGGSPVTISISGFDTRENAMPILNAILADIETWDSDQTLVHFGAEILRNTTGTVDPIDLTQVYAQTAQNTTFSAYTFKHGKRFPINVVSLPNFGGWPTPRSTVKRTVSGGPMDDTLFTLRVSLPSLSLQIINS